MAVGALSLLAVRNWPFRQPFGESDPESTTDNPIPVLQQLRIGHNTAKLNRVQASDLAVFSPFLCWLAGQQVLEGLPSRGEPRLRVEVLRMIAGKLYTAFVVFVVLAVSVTAFVAPRPLEPPRRSAATTRR